jgi:hypothetical protein
MIVVLAGAVKTMLSNIESSTWKLATTIALAIASVAWPAQQLRAQAPDQTTSAMLTLPEPADPGPASNNPGPAFTDAAAPTVAAPAPVDDRIFGLMPNYTTVEGSSDVPPLTPAQKFKMQAQGVFDPYEFSIVGLLAGLNQAQNEDAAYGQGLAGYARRYASGFADQSIGNFMTGAIFPTLLREDPRYFRLGSGSFARRFRYALTRLLLTRTDAGPGHTQFNFSEFLGNGAAAGISNFYEVRQDRTFSNTATTWAEQISIDGLGFELKEFWPDIRRKLFRKG